ncbi:MAG TPA: hypothetical protein PLM98_13570, partial [Thiolinea sp.]|nr:hypothetical protein [Thiolinea sp.]
MDKFTQPTTWRRAAKWRRAFFFTAIICITALASYWLGANLPTKLPWFWQILVIAPFSLLFFWLVLGFMTAVTGLWVMVRGDP